MILTSYKWTCGNCGNVFEAPIASDYGEFTMASKGTGAFVTLDAPRDPVFLEVRELLKSFDAYSGADQWTRRDILHGAFSVACDLADDGTEYEMEGPPSCPVCHSRKMASYTSARHDWPESQPIPAVTHHAWERLAEEEKRSLLQNWLEKNGYPTD